MKYAFAIIPFIIILSGCDAVDLRDVRSASLKLQPGMTEVEAINVMGFPPDRAQLGACGAKTKEGAWTCRSLIFLGDNGRLIVQETLVDNVWHVNSWSFF